MVVGNSIGGYISAFLAAENPNLVQGTPPPPLGAAASFCDWPMPLQHNISIRRSELAGSNRSLLQEQ